MSFNEGTNAVSSECQAFEKLKLAFFDTPNVLTFWVPGAGRAMPESGKRGKEKGCLSA